MKKTLIISFLLSIVGLPVFSGELQNQYEKDLGLKSYNNKYKLKYIKKDYQKFLNGKKSVIGQIKKDYDKINPSHKPSKEPNIFYLVGMRTKLVNAAKTNKLPQYWNLSDAEFKNLLDTTKKDICVYNSYTKKPEKVHFAQQEFIDTVEQEEKEFLNMAQFGKVHDITFDNLINKYNKAIENLNANHFYDTDENDSYYKNNWVKLTMTEGSYYYALNDAYIEKKYRKHISSTYSEWLRFLDKNAKIFEDGGLAIPVDDLRKNIIKLENFIEENCNFAALFQVKNELELYTHVYMMGSDNNPIFDKWNTKKMYPEYKKSYEKFLLKNKNSNYYPMVKEFYDKAKENDFEYNKAVKNATF